MRRRLKVDQVNNILAKLISLIVSVFVAIAIEHGRDSCHQRAISQLVGIELVIKLTKS